MINGAIRIGAIGAGGLGLFALQHFAQIPGVELMELFKTARLDMTGIFGEPTRVASGRHKSLDIYQKIEISYDCEEDKMVRYGQLLRAMLRDRIRWIYDRNHSRKISEANGRDSLAAAVEATKFADQSR